MFEAINTKKYLYWDIAQFTDEMKLFNKDRAMKLVEKMDRLGISPLDVISQIESKIGPAYETFRKFNKVGQDDFYQELFSCLALIDFVVREDVEGVAFPVNDKCPTDVRLFELKQYIENDTEYDFLIKKNGSFLKFQLKSAPEQYIQAFSSTYFIKNIIQKTTKYNDPEMILVYLLQPSKIRTTTKEFYLMIEEICRGVNMELPIQNIIFLGRSDLQTFEFIQVYREVVRTQINIPDTLAGEVRDYKPF